METYQESRHAHHPGQVHEGAATMAGDEATVGERGNFKIFLRTRKIMVMHSNERGECCLRTLVDRQRKR